MNVDVAITTLSKHIARDCAGCSECESALTALQSNLTRPAIRAARRSLAGRPASTVPSFVALHHTAVVEDDVPPPPDFHAALMASRKEN
jgi:hypothetical protein